LRPHQVKAFVQATPQQHRQGQGEKQNGSGVQPHFLGVGRRFFQLFGNRITSDIIGIISLLMAIFALVAVVLVKSSEKKYLLLSHLDM
jgi:hypothetical protein